MKKESFSTYLRACFFIRSFFTSKSVSKAKKIDFKDFSLKSIFDDLTLLTSCPCQDPLLEQLVRLVQVCLPLQLLLLTTKRQRRQRFAKQSGQL